MARRTIPESIYISCVHLRIARLCVVYIAKEVASFPGASSVNFMGVAHNRTCARALQSSKPEEGKLLVALKLIASYST